MRRVLSIAVASAALLLVSAELNGARAQCYDGYGYRSYGRSYHHDVGYRRDYRDSYHRRNYRDTYHRHGYRRSYRYDRPRHYRRSYRPYRSHRRGYGYCY